MVGCTHAALTGQGVHNSNNDETYSKITTALGILPNSRIRVFICVEGKHDITFLKTITPIIMEIDDKMPDLRCEPQIAFIPLGGSTLKDWVAMNYLKELKIPEIHIYDRDNIENPNYKNEHDLVNNRKDGSIAFLTSKREIENYIHPNVINQYFGISINPTNDDDVITLIYNELQMTSKPLSAKNIKGRLNSEAVKLMTATQLNEIDNQNEILTWFNEIYKKINDR